MNGRVSISKNSERLTVDPEQIRSLTRLIGQGEGQQLEFKAKTNFPDKIIHELIAFANTQGGTLLIGVGDDGKLLGVKYPEEDQMLVVKAIKKYCWPPIKINSSIIKISEKKWVVVFKVFESSKKPVRFKVSRTNRVAYIRHNDKTLQASRETEGILKLRFSRHAESFNYGEVENIILKTLDSKRQATLNELRVLTGIEESILSGRLIRLAAANVIGWKPSHQSDIFISS